MSFNVCSKENQAFTLDLEKYKDKNLKIDTFEVEKNSISTIEDILNHSDIALTQDDIATIDVELSQKANWLTTKDFEDENSILKSEYSQLKNLDIPIAEIEKNRKGKEQER